ncbi:DUF1598 domain-containing protein [Planctomyces sp. SH-PL14]|uniref:DUF1598 domain-containing protein n=1 Tax=Planctomyces sp. SH-PL14 TaxID=1632864 RepID=UPI00078D233A|nr:DUF1598 domain-containing protein [Planctomyces sp. SH-PL14]AMV22742.1 hypothetical protein VT03_32910 [Planctomyces sp. SH-PL14]
MPKNPWSRLLQRAFVGTSLSMVLCAGLTPASGAEMNLAARVRGFIAAGEFGSALNAAESAKDPAQRNALIREVAETQLALGDTFGAVRSASRYTSGPARVATEGQAAQQDSLKGGFGANFQPLMDLIQQETGGVTGPWDADEPGTGTISSFESGVRVDPQGILSRVSREEKSGRLEALGIRAREADLNPDIAAVSKLRMVSLTRLEKEVARSIEAGEPVVESMRQLAGLSEIQYVFVYPEAGEVVLAGPAEGWRYNESGMPVGTGSGKPTLQLDDLVTVLRTFSEGGQNIFGCSIDPKADKLKEVKSFVEASQAKGPLEPSQVRGWAQKIGQTLGRQDISIYGVPQDSRVARVILEADYEMKLIGIGKVEGGSNVPDYFELLRKNPAAAAGSLDALRWWLSIKSDEVLHSPDHSAFEIRGTSVRCQSENQFLTETGKRVQTGKAEPVNQQFAKNFTEHFADLAQREHVFADLEGVFDLALTAALIEREDVDGRIGWDRGVFAPGGAYQTARFGTPKEVDTVVNHRVMNGKDVVVQVAGGVRVDVASAMEAAGQKESAALSGVATTARPSELPEGRWWWDAK